MPYNKLFPVPGSGGGSSIFGSFANNPKKRINSFFPLDNAVNKLYIHTMKKIISKAITIGLALTFNAFSANIPGYCAEEIVSLSKKKGFDVQEFVKDLPAAVAEAKLKAKMPFGKPKDSDKMDIGITFGCLKAFPENPGQIQALLKDVGLGAAKGVAVGAGVGTKTNSRPGLKECDVVFNPAKKFCYDGEVYNLCDGMSYNPTTHICSGDIANRALCNGKQYNPLKQKCENNVILAVCGTTTYNPATHGCKDNAVFALSKCGANYYDPATHDCKNNVVFALSKCGANYYDPATHGCKDNAVFVLPRCGETIYNPATHDCKDNAVFAVSKCGTEFYNPKTQECRFGSVFEK